MKNFWKLLGGDQITISSENTNKFAYILVSILLLLLILFFIGYFYSGNKKNDE